ncbi:glycosyltransferase [Vibrio alfacsensis]|uniref:glycosyltransferase n=1 Tax=Vibrio alfacsensis TaxID=1074311 RepID=UPI0040687DD0
MEVKISVCMAVYNGAKYLEQQLESIFTQTQAVNEVIIIDDGSSDNSELIVRLFYNKLPIVYIRNEINIGVIKTFEKALMVATGNILILCDQDDVWRKDKVSIIKDCLDSNGGLCISNYQVIDKKGQNSAIHSSFKKSDFGIVQSIIKNSFIGCCMAFDREVLDCSLPFPERIPMHDSWIGINAILSSKVTIIEDELIYYRRHGENVTGVRGKVSRMLSDRYNIIVSLLLRIVGKK